MTWYKTGTVTVTAGSNAVIGIGTAFIRNARVGDGFRGPDGGWYEITNIASDTAMAISPPYGDPSAYAVAPLQGYLKDSADALREATRTIAGGIADMEDQVTAATKAAESAGQSKVVATEQAGIATAAADLSTGNKNAAQQAAQQSQSSAGASDAAAVRAETAKDSIVQSEQAAANSADAAAASAQHAEEVTIGKAARGDNNDITSLRALTSDGFDRLRQGIAPMGGATATAAGKKGLVPAGAAGDQDKFLTAAGVYKDAGGGLPVGSLVAHDGTEADIPPGQIARYGQELNRADWPDLWAKVAARAVDDSVWLAAPYDKRGKYSKGNGTTTFRMPDTNAKHPDGNTIAAMFLRGNGKSSSGDAGLHRADQVQGFNVGMGVWKLTRFTTGYASAGVNGTTQRTGPYFTESNLWPTEPVAVPVSDGTNGTPRIGNETRPAAETVIWCTVGAGKATNPGSVDVTALATTVSNQSSQIQILDASLGFAYVYPNGGTEASPAVVAVYTQYTNPNPFPGHPVICEAQVLQGGEWVSPGWYGNNSSAVGVKSSQGADAIRTSTGLGALLIGYQWGGGSTVSNTGSGISSLPCRVRVWRVKA